MKYIQIVFLVMMFPLCRSFAGSDLETPSLDKSVLLVAGYAEMGWLEIHLDAIRNRHHRVVYELKNDQLDQFQVIILTRNFKYADFDWKLFDSFFKKGGELVVVGQAISPVLKNLPLVFGPKVRYRRVEGREFEYADNRLLSDAIKKRLNVLKPSDALSGLDGGQWLIRKSDLVYGWRKKIDAGGILFIPTRMIIPPWPANFYKLKTPYFTAKNMKTKLFCDKSFKALLDYLGVVELQRKAAEAGSGKAVLWNRKKDDSIALFEGAMSLAPPFPRDKSELIQSVEIESGTLGYTRKMFFLNFQHDVKDVTFNFSDLRSGENIISKKRIRVGVQGKLSPEYRGPYVYVNWMKNNDSIFSLSTVSTLWLEVRVEGVSSGEYAGEVKLTEGGKELAIIPLSVTVRNIPSPSLQSFKFCLEFSVHDLRGVPIDAWLEQWERLGVSFLNAGNSAWDQYDPIVRSTGRRLSEYAVQSSKPLKDRVPLLDFSLETQGRFDLLLQKSVSSNLTTYRTYYFNGQFRKNFVMLAQKLYRDDRINVSSPEVGLTATAVMRQLGVFLREKGMLEYYSKSLDEWHANALPAYLSVAKYVHKAGWGNIGNPDVSVLGNRYLRDRIWKYIQIYWMEVHPEFWADLRAHIKPPESTMPCGYFSFATSSYWWNNSYMDGREIMWASAFNGDAGFHMHGWARGKTYAGVYFLDGRKKPCPSMGLLMYSEAVSDARYIKMLQSMLVFLKEHNPTAYNRHHSQWRKILNNSPDALLQVVNGRILAKNLFSESFRTAKSAMFGLIENIVKDLKQIKIKPTLKWSDIRIVEKGMPIIEIIYDPSLKEAAVRLQRYVNSRADVALKLSKCDTTKLNVSETKNAIILCDISSNKSRERISKLLHGVITLKYPHPGSYVFRDDKPNNTLWIIGDSATCINTAILNFSKTLKLDPYWYSPKEFNK